MHRLKAIFISVYAAMAMGIAGMATYELLAHGLDLGWIGAALSVAPFLAVVGSLMMLQNRARTRTRLPVATSASIAGAFAACLAVATLSSAPAAAVLAVVGTAGHLVYVFWYSTLDRTLSSLLHVGSALPPLVFETAGRKVVTTADLRGRPALLLFYRGNWCPLCMAQIKEIAAQYQRLAERVDVVLVSPQPHENTAELAARFEVPFRFLVDPGNRAARALGIDAPGGLPLGFGLLGYDEDTVLPTVVLIDEHGVIRFVDQTDNYRVRPDPSTFLAILDGLRQPLK